MSVSGLEQRVAPLVLTSPVWTPWGPGVFAPLPYDEDEEEHVVEQSKPKRTERRRSHSWAGHATYMQTTRHGIAYTLPDPTPPQNLATPIKGFNRNERGGRTPSEVSTSDTSSISDMTFSSDSCDNESMTKCRTSPPRKVVKKAVVADADTATTLAIRNMPFSVTREELLKAMDASGFAGMYDFVYLPHKFKEHRNMGFAFVNFIDADVARQFQATWHKSRPFEVKRTLKPLNVSLAEVQGKAANEFNAQSRKMDRVRNTSFRPFLQGSSVNMAD